MTDFDVSDSENRLDVQADRSHFALSGYRLSGTILPEAQIFNCILNQNHAMQLKSLLDTWLFQERGGKIGHVSWELTQLIESLGCVGVGEEARASQILEEAFEHMAEEQILVPEVVMQLSLALSSLLEHWLDTQRYLASTQ